MINKKITFAFVSLISSFTALNSYAEGSLAVSKQVTLNVPPSTAWALLSDFNGLNRWHPAVANSELSGDGQTTGSKRVLTLGDGAKINETLLNYDATDKSYSYKITESPLPVSDYVSTIKVEKNDLGTSTVTWNSTFDAAGVNDAKAIEVITGVYDAGLNALADLY